MYLFRHSLKYGKIHLPWLAELFDPFKGFIGFLAAFTLLDKIRATLGFRTSSMLVLAEKI